MRIAFKADTLRLGFREEPVQQFSGDIRVAWRPHNEWGIEITLIPDNEEEKESLLEVVKRWEEDGEIDLSFLGSG